MGVLLCLDLAPGLKSVSAAVRAKILPHSSNKSPQQMQLLNPLGKVGVLPVSSMLLEGGTFSSMESFFLDEEVEVG